MLLVEVRGSFETPSGDESTGSVEFYPRVSSIQSGSEIIATHITLARLDNGAFSVSLQATDAPGFLPTGWTYRVIEKIDGRLWRVYDIAVPSASQGSGIDLSIVAPVEPASGDVTSFVTSVIGRTGAVTGAQIAADSALIAAFDSAGAAAAAQAAAQAASQPLNAAIFYPERYGSVVGDATTAVRAALTAAMAAGGEIRFMETKTYTVDTLFVTGACSIYIPASTTVKLKDAGTEVAGMLTVFKITASNVDLVCKGWIDANRAGQNKTAFNAAGGSNGGKFYFGVRVQGTSVTPLTNVVVDARIKNSVDMALSVYYVTAGCEFIVHAATCGAGASVSDSSDFSIPMVDLQSLDNAGWKVFPHAFDLIRCTRPQVGTATVRDQFGTGTVAAGTALSNFVSGITFVDVQDGVFHSLSASARSDVTMRQGLGISWLSVRRCTLSAFEIRGYNELGFEMGGVVGCQVANGLIDGRYQTGAGSPNGRGWSIYNNGYYPDFAGRSQRYSENNQFANIRVTRCMGEGIYQSAGRFNTFTSVSANACQVGIRQEWDPATAVQSFPGQSFVDLEGNTFIGCEFSYNEWYGTKFVDARNTRLIGCRSNNNGQSLNYGGFTRQGSFLVFDTAGINFATSVSSGSVKSGVTLVDCESTDDQTWAETVSFDPANPTVVYPATTARYHVGQTIALFGAGPAGPALNLYARINSIELDAVTISDPIVVSTTIAGTGTISSTDSVVTGAGTAFNSELRSRYFIVASGQTRQVAAVTDNTHMAITVAFSPALAPGTAFTIYKTPGSAARSQKYGAKFSADTLAPQVIGGTWTGNITAAFSDLTVHTSPAENSASTLRYVSVWDGTTWRSSAASP